MMAVFKVVIKNTTISVETAAPAKNGKTADPAKSRKKSVPAKPVNSGRKMTAARQESEQSRFAKKLRLDQTAAGIVGGTAGLVMLLDVLLHDAEKKDANAFYFHADAYIQRAKRLGKLLEDYRQLEVNSRDVVLYRKLYVLGRELRDYRTPPEQMTDEAFRLWREKIEEWFRLYNEDEEQ